MVTFQCKNCGLLTKDSLYLRTGFENGKEVIVLHCDVCNEECMPSREVLEDDSLIEELTQILHDLAIKLHEKEFIEALYTLIATGDVAIAGIDKSGEMYYEITDKGRETKKEMFDD